jgi:hypothetical protein
MPTFLEAMFAVERQRARMLRCQTPSQSVVAPRCGARALGGIA